MDPNQDLRATPTSSTISRAKQTRIDIWRNEVAALTLDTDVLDPNSAAGVKLSSRHSPPPSSATSSASSSSSAVLSSPSAADLSRGRRLWRRLSHRLTGRPLDPLPLPVVVRTEMYRIEPPAAAVQSPEDAHQTQPQEEDGLRSPADDDHQREDLGAIGDNHSSSSRADGRGGLREKQERLERAARLLDQGVARTE